MNLRSQGPWDKPWNDQKMSTLSSLKRHDHDAVGFNFIYGINKG